jgi:hypothetical protein
MRRGPFRAALQQIGHERLGRGLAQLRLRPGFGTPAQEGVHPALYILMVPAALRSARNARSQPTVVRVDLANCWP